MPLDIFPDIQKNLAFSRFFPAFWRIEPMDSGRERKFLSVMSLEEKAFSFWSHPVFFNGPMKRYGILLQE
ncbi:hypothetical protein BOX24_01705 [Leptospirillum ferriphilum]|uniref:Uncharacterized protein n=1 Tax=Leptospirillum ferriphilum TaxID=178606 RepID=A0A1V3SZ96_9BACT|nr:hypothetical protein BOX24_01705 [Leptospirillum ferriphilum]